MLYSLRDEHVIRPSDPEVAAAVCVLEAAINSAARPGGPRNRRGSEREYKSAGARFDDLARVAEYVETL